MGEIEDIWDLLGGIRDIGYIEDVGDVRNVEYLEAQQPFMRDIVDMGDMGDIGDTGEIQNNTMMTHPPTDQRTELNLEMLLHLKI